MKKITAGRIVIEVADPYPIWLNIYKDELNSDAIRISHNELSDLKYAVDKAIKECRLGLPEKDRDEV